MKITLNTDVNAPNSCFEVLAEDGRSIFVQSDNDYCGFASAFGWSVHNVQKCRECGHVCDVAYSCNRFACAECENPLIRDCCDHNSTDGTVTCKACGLTAGDFIARAYDYIMANDGATADDPGYFDGEYISVRGNDVIDYASEVVAVRVLPRHCASCGDELGSDWDRATVHIDPEDGISCGGKIID